MSAAIGLDIGHSAVKVAVSDSKGKRNAFIIPTALCQAFKISDEAEAERAARETVRVGNVDYFIGETAVIQGGINVTSGLSEDWVSTPEHTALMIGAFKKAKEFAGVDQPKLVLGLPTHLYSRQREKLREIASNALPVNDVRVVPQPMGPYFEAMFDEKGVPASAVNEESWGVVEIGYFTTDFMLMMNGRWVEKASGTCSGARVAAEHLQRILSENGVTADLPECEEALRKKYIRNFTSKIDVTKEVNEAVGILANEVIDHATRLMEPYARRLDGVIVAGGGADFMFDKIKERWPHATSPQNPRFSVAEGMRRFASMLNIKDTLKED
jgi:plasmid segregation protein ParM